jgi:hypothetical protein
MPIAIMYSDSQCNEELPGHDKMILQFFDFSSFPPPLDLMLAFFAKVGEIYLMTQIT